MVVEWIARNQVRDVADMRAFLSESHGGNLRLRKNHFGQEPVVHLLHLARMGDIVRGDLGLLDGDVDDLVQAGAVTGCVDVWNCGLHLRVGRNAVIFELHADLLKPEPGDIGDSAKSEEDLVSMHADGLFLMFEHDILLTLGTPRVEQFGSRVKDDAFSPKDLFQFASGIRIKFMEDVRTALNEGDFNSESSEKLGELDGDSAATKNDQGAGQMSQLERGIAVKAINLVKLGQR